MMGSAVNACQTTTIEVRLLKNFYLGLETFMNIVAVLYKVSGLNSTCKKKSCVGDVSCLGPAIDPVPSTAGNVTSNLYIHGMGFWSVYGVLGHCLHVHECHYGGEALGNFLWDLELYGSSMGSEIGIFHLNMNVRV